MRISDWSSDVCSSDLSITYLVIFSLLWSNTVWCMQGIDGSDSDNERPTSPRRQLIKIEEQDLKNNPQEGILPESNLEEHPQEISPLDRKSKRLNSSNKCASRMPP